MELKNKIKHEDEDELEIPDEEEEESKYLNKYGDYEEEEEDIILERDSLRK